MQGSHISWLDIAIYTAGYLLPHLVALVGSGSASLVDTCVYSPSLYHEFDNERVGRLPLLANYSINDVRDVAITMIVRYNYHARMRRGKVCACAMNSICHPVQ